MNHLPSHIILDILSRLHALTIIHCKLVCKSWLDLISSPDFIPLHFSRAQVGLIVHHSEMFRSFLKVVDYDNGLDHNSLFYNRRAKFDLTTLSDFSDVDIVVDGSVNGLLLLRDVNYKHETLYICNPITHEYVVLPKPNQTVRYPSVVTHGFGLTDSTGQYKVVRIFQKHELHPITRSCSRIHSSVFEVYTLGTWSWREIRKSRFAYDSRSIGLFFKGNLHWIVEDLDEKEMLISCFDLEKELFDSFSLPFQCPGRAMGRLSVFNGYLCLCDNSSPYEIGIWVVKEYGVKKTWVKEISINKKRELLGSPYEKVYALKVFRDGVILLLARDLLMFFYCSKSKSVRVVDMDQTRGPNSIEAIHYLPNFISLRSLTVDDVYVAMRKVGKRRCIR